MRSSNCPPELRGSAQEALVAAIRRGYDEANAIYDPGRGLGDTLYGQAVYSVASHHIARTFDGWPGAAVVSRGRGPELHIGGNRVRWNKVGRGTDGGGIRGRYPRGSRAAAAMANENQLRLFSEDALEPDGVATNWILAHLGNPIEGLVAIYLASPIETDGDSVTGWRDIIPIWSAADPMSDAPEAPVPGLPEPVELGALEVLLVDEGDTAAEG